MHIIVKADLHILYMYAECLVRVLYLPFRLYSPPPPSLSLSANAKGRKLEEQGDLGGSCATLLQASNTKGRTVRGHPPSQSHFPLFKIPILAYLFILSLQSFFSTLSNLFPLFLTFIHTCTSSFPTHTHTHTLHSPSQCMSRAMDQS